MRHLLPITFALLLVVCGGTPQAVAPSSTPRPTGSAPATSPTPVPTYPPKAEGFTSKLLVEKPRNIATSAPGFISIIAGSSSDGGVSAAVSDAETFTGSYRLATDASPAATVYSTPQLPPLAAGRYGESLRLVTVQPAGRSAAHMHSGIEGVLVLEGRVLVRTAGQAPAFLNVREGFYILPKTPVQLINAGATVARTLVYSISPEGVPYSVELDESP
jgi:hypothetical protein